MTAIGFDSGSETATGFVTDLALDPVPETDPALGLEIDSGSGFGTDSEIELGFDPGLGSVKSGWSS